ncbi:MAG: TonB-dependent receptor [Verrucomicrobia bacterium]|nr:TonB-dependent receptor [Verrucomicrobiota bacterium]
MQNVETGQYLNNARVALKGTGVLAFTDQTGTYRLVGVPKGRVVLEAFYTGLDAQQATLEIAAGQGLEHDFRLGAGTVVTLDKFTVKAAAVQIGVKRSVQENDKRFETVNWTYNGPNGNATTVPQSYAPYMNILANKKLETSGPDFSRIIPNATISEANLTELQYNDPSVVRGTINIRNTALKPWSAVNYDLSLEYYTDQGGLVTVGVFRKEIKDFFGNVVKLATAADFTSFIKSSANWGFNFTRERFDFMARWNYRGQQKGGALAALGPDAFTYTGATTMLDLNADYRFKKQLAFFISARNVFNLDRLRFGYGSLTPDYAKQNFTREYGTQYTAGIKGTF